MSGRGRGSGGYSNPSEFPSLHAGGGRGRGRGGGQGRGGGRSTTPSCYEVGGSSGGGGGGQGRGGGRSTTASGYEAGGSSSGDSAAMLSREMQQRLTLQPRESAPAPPQPQIVAPPASSKSLKFAQRPGYGTVGRKCLITANHFLVELEDKVLHHYDVTISPEVTSRGVNRAVMKQLIDTHRVSDFDGLKPAYDGRKGLYTASSLPFDSKEFVIKLADKDKEAKSGVSGSKIKRERDFKVSIKFASKADIHHLKQFLGGRQRDAPHETIQVLDVVLRESPSNKCTVVGRSFFSSSWGEKTEIGSGAECWKGFYQSLRLTQMGMSLNMDVSATAFYQTITVIEFAVKFLNVDPARAALFHPSDSDLVKLKKALRGVRVKVTHGKNRVYKVTGLSPQPTNRLLFSDDDRQKKSVVQYFHEKYNIALTYASWPALQCGSDSRPIYIPMETCKIVEGQRYSRKLNERQVTALLKEACKRPNIRQSTIQTIADHNSYKEDELAKEFGVHVVQQLTKIDARILPPPSIKYHDSGRDRVIQPRTGAWNMINAKMFRGASIKAWTCINFSSLQEQVVIGFCRDLIGMCNHKGVDIQAAPIIPIQSARSNQIDRALADLHTQCCRSEAALQLLIVILPDFSGSYGKIKRICETELGIVSQCCQPKQARKCNPQYLENVVLKINVKAGGQNAVWEDTLYRRVPPITDCPTIIFGADVTHPQPGEDSSPSIAAVVASMDWPTVTTYKALVSSQGHREEIIQDLFRKIQDPVLGDVCSGMVRELLMAFRRSTGHKPLRIICYRDGVSEGQFSQVLLQEMDAIRKVGAIVEDQLGVACQSLEENYLPPVTFVIVQKRHHTRLFPTNQKDTDKSGNILPGTVVDTKICHPFEHDFYLCSHAGIQGTSRPAHYHVLFDENNFNANAMQMLTNNLCYTYARCTRSVSVVPPAYYAHLAAFRARYYIEGDSQGSDGVSSTGGGARRESAVFRPLPSIAPNVKEIMFFC